MLEGSHQRPRGRSAPRRIAGTAERELISMARHFDPRKVLKQVSNRLLRKFFSQRGELQDVAWDGLPETQIAPVFAAWQQLPDVRRKEVQVILQDVNELADERGLGVLAEEIRRWCPEKMAEFAMLEGRCDKAMWVHLEMPDIFDEAAMFARADALESGRYWVKRNSLPRVPLAVDDRMRQSLAEALVGYYKPNQCRGYWCHIEHYQRGNGDDYFFAYLDDYPDNRLVFDDGGQMHKQPERDAFTNVFVYSRTDGTLDMFARGGRKVYEPLQGAFCRAVLADDIDPADPDKPAFLLEGFKDRAMQLPTDPADRVAEVRVRKMGLAAVDSPGDEITVKAGGSHDRNHIYDLIDQWLDARNLPMTRVQVTRVTVTLKFMSDGQRKARTMTFDVSCPNSCNLKSKPDEMRAVGERCLKLWGVAQ
ncbi:MAG: hypothetical protein BIFFINMI_00936 [Phycisphaerae bacterium]|nr:hypothetical protein [Phycisphaerae bacterium]